MREKMSLEELKTKADRWGKLQAMIQAMEVQMAEGGPTVEAQLKDVLANCRSEADRLSGCQEEYAEAWEQKRAEVEASGGKAWEEVLRCMDEIQKYEQKIQEMYEVIQWLVIEA